MNRTTIDLWVGVFVAMGIAALVFLALKAGGFLLVGGTQNKNTSDHDLIITRFDAKGKQLWKRIYAT